MREVLIEYRVLVRRKVYDKDRSTMDAVHRANEDVRAMEGYVGHVQPVIWEVTG